MAIRVLSDDDASFALEPSNAGDLGWFATPEGPSVQRDDATVPLPQQATGSGTSGFSPQKTRRTRQPKKEVAAERIEVESMLFRGMPTEEICHRLKLSKAKVARHIAAILDLKGQIPSSRYKVLPAQSLPELLRASMGLSREDLVKFAVGADRVVTLFPFTPVEG